MVSDRAFNELKKEVISNRLGNGVGYVLKRSGSGTTLAIKPSTASGESSHPFQVILKNVGTAESPSWKGGVVYESSLYQSLKPNDKKAITGLLSEDKTTGWFDVIGNDCIWLGIVFNTSGVITSANIDSWGQSDSFQIDKAAWSGDNGYCEDDGGTPKKHQTSRKIIAYTIAGSGGQPILTQSMFKDQVLRNVCIDSRPAIYPFDHEGGYPI